MNFYCIKHGTKYSAEFVNKLNNMIGRHWIGEYKLYCITEDSEGVVCDTIELPNYGLEKWWTKICLFDESFLQEGIFLDLDIIIRDNINWMFEPSEEMKFLYTDWVNLEQLHKDTVSNRTRYCSINSSVLCWNKETKRQYIFDDFMKNKDKILFSFTGIDSFIEHRHKYDLYATGKAYSYHKSLGTGLESVVLFDYGLKQNEINENWIKMLWT
jgi:hypothetical protein